MKKYLVNVPLTDLRSNKQSSSSSVSGIDRSQLTQALYGETLLVTQSEGDWSFVQLLEQTKYQNDSLQGYPGWMQTKHLSSVHSFPTYNAIVKVPFSFIDTSQKKMCFLFATKLNVIHCELDTSTFLLNDGQKAYIDTKDLLFFDQTFSTRDMILKAAKQFLGAPYLWGGNSPYLPHWKEGKTSLDCSSLVYLTHRLCGISVPRDSCDQARSSFPLNASPEKGDLVFFANPNKNNHVHHVLIVASDKFLIESTEASQNVRLISAVERLTAPLHSLFSGEIYGGQRLLLRSFIP